MYNPIIMPAPEGLRPVPPEVLEWARGVGAAKPKAPPLADVPTEIPGFSTRNLPGTDNSKIDRGAVQRLSELTREFAALKRDENVRTPLVRQELISFRKEHPETGGGTWDQEHGNFRVTVVAEKPPKFNDKLIVQSLGEKAGIVYGPGIEVLLRVIRSLETGDGQEIPPENIYIAIRHALLGLRATEESVDEVLSIRKVERLAERRDNLALAKLVLDGESVEGITFEPEYRVEFDAVEKTKPIKVRRPRRKNLKFNPRSKNPRS